MSLRDTLQRDLWQDPNYEVQQVSCMELVFCNINRELYGKLLGEGTSAGAKFNGSTADFKGCEFDWNYDEASGNLRVTCTKKPFYLNCAQIESALTKLINQAKEAI